jgi:Fur family peroxide stress response transcriptional regulator
MIMFDFPPQHINNPFSGRLFQHPHVICTKCKEIMDPALVSLDELSEEMSSKTGHKILYHRLDFFGLCPRCQEEGMG